MSRAIGVAEPGQSLADSLRVAFAHSAQHATAIAVMLRMAGEDARAEEYDRRALIDGTRAKRYERIPVTKVVR